MIDPSRLRKIKIEEFNKTVVALTGFLNQRQVAPGMAIAVLGRTLAATLAGISENEGELLDHIRFCNDNLRSDACEHFVQIQKDRRR